MCPPVFGDKCYMQSINTEKNWTSEMSISYLQREKLQENSTSTIGNSRTPQYYPQQLISCFLSQPCLTPADDVQSSACPKLQFFFCLSYGTCAVHGLSLWPVEGQCTANCRIFSVQNTKADAWALQRPWITKGCLHQWHGEKACRASELQCDLEKCFNFLSHIL